MSENPNASQHSPLTAAERLSKHIQVLRYQVVGCQLKLEMATHQLSFVQAALAETRDQLDVTNQALEQMAREI